MPTYAYACTACDHAFDLVQSFSDDPLTVCPQCQGRLRKVYTSIGVTFKGSGFYRTDSRAANGSGSSKSPARGFGGSSGSSGGSEGSSGSSSGEGSSTTASSNGSASSGSTGAAGSSSTSTATP